jgi:hypothetical protein
MMTRVGEAVGVPIERKRFCERELVAERFRNGSIPSLARSPLVACLVAV